MSGKSQGGGTASNSAAANYLIHTLYVRQDFDECLGVIEDQIPSSSTDDEWIGGGERDVESLPRAGDDLEKRFGH